jgi:hypothetical protein
MPVADAREAVFERPAAGSSRATSHGFLELSVFLVELAQRRAFGRIELVVQNGRVGMVKWEEHFKPGELPIRDRDRLEQLKGKTPTTG